MQLSLAKLLILLASLTALTPLAIDAYLPAMPSMANSFNSSIHDIELSLSLFLAGFSLGELYGGAMSDHVGRRQTIFTGLIIFSVGTLGIILSSSLTSLLTFRIIEAFGGGLAIVNSSAIIRDISQGRNNAKNLSHMALIMMIAPLSAPLIGSSILHLTSWHGIFVFLFMYAVVVCLLIFRYIPETSPTKTHKISVIQRYLSVFKHREAVSYLLSLCFAYGGMFTFITASPSVYMGCFNVSEAIYPFLFGANIISMIIANRLNVFLLNYFPPQRLLSLGQFIQFISAVVLLTYALLTPELALWIVVSLIMLFVGSQSFIVSNASSSTLEFFPHNSGTASAVLGASGYATGAVMGTVVGLLGDGTPLPMAQVMLMCITSGITLRYLMSRLVNRD